MMIVSAQISWRKTLKNSQYALATFFIYKICFSHPILIKQNWNNLERAEAHHLDEGSQMIPYNWLKNLEAYNSGSLFLNQVNKYGLYYSNESSLPTGISISHDERTQELYGAKEWAGINCTACHTSVFKINNKEVQIEGGAGNFDLHKFQTELIYSIESTLEKNYKFNRFAKRLQKLSIKDKKELRKYLEKFSKDFRGYLERNHRDYKTKGFLNYGPGRMDGIGGPTNDINCETAELGDLNFKAKLTNRKNCRQSHSPVSIPHLWGITEQEFVQWGGNVHSSIGRNIGQSTGVFAKNWFSRNENNQPNFETTANLNGILKFEKLYDKLRAPSWQSLAEKNIVRPLNKEVVKRGRKHYKKHCISCHAIQPKFTNPNKYGHQYWKVVVTPLDEIQTDKNAILELSSRKNYLPNDLYDTYIDKFGENSIGADGTVNSSQYRAFAIGKYLESLFKQNNFTPIEMLKASDCRDGRQQEIIGYKARSLEGIIFTAPYLHNGAVPTLIDLLSPASERPQSFYLGCQNYDVHKMGYRCNHLIDRNLYHYDTTLKGNSNSGHEYGTNLSIREKFELIEFLKSLRPPKRPPKPENSPCAS